MREQRWTLLLLLLWVVGSCLGGYFTGDTDDALFFFKQQAVYGVAFTTFLAATAVRNERKSRRILAVLSKGVGRGEYLAGLLAGVMGIVGLYCLTMGAAGSWMLAGSRVPGAEVWAIVADVAGACLLGATVAILFSTFMEPLLATAATALLLGIPAAAGSVLGRGWLAVLPAYGLMASAMEFAPGRRANAHWGMLTSGIAQSALVWALAAWVFSRRDIAVAVE